MFTASSVLRALARRVRAMEAEAAEHERAIRAIVGSWRPDLLERSGVGLINAATVLAAWSHPGRCRSDAAFAMLDGAAPIPASSGKTAASGSTAREIASSTGHCTTSCYPGCATTSPLGPAPGVAGVRGKDRP